VILGIFLFGTPRVGEFLEKVSPSSASATTCTTSLPQVGTYVNDVEKASQEKGKPWKRRPTALF